MNRLSYFATFFGLMVALSLWVILSLQFPFSVSGFEIFSTQDNNIVVKDADIASYNLASHELTLTAEATERLKRMMGYLEGQFTIIVGGEEVLNGIFVPPVISRSYPSSEVVITYPTFDSNYSVMRIQMGYPWDTPVAPDSRDDPRIANYFQVTGRLIR